MGRNKEEEDSFSSWLFIIILSIIPPQVEEAAGLFRSFWSWLLELEFLELIVVVVIVLLFKIIGEQLFVSLEQEGEEELELEEEEEESGEESGEEIFV